MTRSRRRAGTSRLAVLAGLLVLLLLVAACGDSGGDASDDNGDDDAADDAGDDADDAGDDDDADDDAGDDGDDGDAAQSDGPPNGYYEGELIEITSPFSAGGSTSLTADLVGRYLAEYLDADAQVVFRDYGGEHRVGTNEWYNLPRDGFNLLMSSGSTHTSAVYDIPGVEWDFADMHPLMGFPLGLVIFAYPGTGMESHLDVLEPDTQLYFGGRAPVGGDIQRTNAFDSLGMDVEELWGYEGRGDMQVAFERGELNLAGETTPAYLNCCAEMAENDEIVPLFTLGNLDADGEIVRDQAFPDMPHIGEVYEDLHGGDPAEDLGLQWEALKLQIATTVQFSKALWAHDGIPDEAREDLEWAVAQIVVDPNFIEDAGAELGGYDVLVGDALTAGVDQYLAGFDPEAVEWLRDWVQERYDVELE